MATIAMTQTISRSVKPASDSALLFIVRGRDIGGRAGAALLPIGAVGDDLIEAAFGRRSIDVGLAPRIIRHVAALEIRPVPSRHAVDRLHQRLQAFGGGGISPGI